MHVHTCKDLRQGESTWLKTVHLPNAGLESMNTLWCSLHFPVQRTEQDTEKIILHHSAGTFLVIPQFQILHSAYFSDKGFKNLLAEARQIRQGGERDKKSSASLLPISFPSWMMVFPRPSSGGILWRQEWHLSVHTPHSKDTTKHFLAAPTRPRSVLQDLEAT